MGRPAVVALFTFGTIGVAAVISLVWFSVSSGQSRFEPAVGLLGLLGGIAGILAERRSAVHERRRIAFVTLDDELRRAERLLTDARLAPAPGRRVYPRLPTSAVDAAVVSGSLSERGDAELLNRLHQWRDAATEFNRRLDITEMCVFVDKDAAETVAAEFDSALHQDNGFLDRIRTDLADLRRFLDSGRELTGKR